MLKLHILPLSLLILPLIFACAPTISPVASTVEVWVTLPDQSKKLQREPDVTMTSIAPGSVALISIDDTIRYQQMEGFGAAMTDSSAWLIMNKLNPSSRNALMRDLFTCEGKGIGLSFVRVPMGASDFALKNYSYDDMQCGQKDTDMRRFNIEYDKQYILPALHQAFWLNPRLRFIGSPWSAPAWMKSNCTPNGGELLPEYYQAFADTMSVLYKPMPRKASKLMH